MKKIRLIHVGVGGRGKWPVRRVTEREDFESVAFVDVNETNLNAALEVSGLSESACFRSLQVALEKVEADAVVVITPPHLHAAQCLEAVRAGKHVLVEKPFTINLAEARQVVQEADAKGVRVAVCQNARYAAQSVTIHRLVRERVYGKPFFGLMTKFGWRPGTHHSGKVRHSYLWERGIHDLDTMRFLFDAQPTQVWGHSFNPPWSPYNHGAGAYAWVSFEGGATCGYLCTFAAHKGGSSLRIDLEGGTLEQVGNEVRLRRPGTDQDEVLPLDPAPAAEAVLMDGFHRYVTEGIEPAFGGHNNLTTMALVEAVGVASDEGRVVDFQAYLKG
ncbi:MAG: Gfo/Idh/MocA family oxidoreductase [Candidatus Latescibacteria bacterium]|nr:Gfo/Idh/MocA family oxidoreductase [Candidatus Latescibacterota bacterium]